MASSPLYFNVPKQEYKDITVHVRMQPNLHQKLSAQAKKADCTVSYFVRTIIERVVDNPDVQVKPANQDQLKQTSFPFGRRAS